MTEWNKWNAERVFQLCDLWLIERKSASQIAGILGMTRNEVIIKVHKLGIDARSNPDAYREYNDHGWFYRGFGKSPRDWMIEADMERRRLSAK